jgi:phage recombination protein Bet
MLSFLTIAAATGLDPLLKQIYLVRRGGQYTTQVSIDGYRLIADRTGRYAPGREPSYEYDAEGRLLSATAYVKKFAGGVWHEIAATAFYDEYVQRTSGGNPTQMWKKMPHLMLAKCAEALALRRAFPGELGGVYTAEEMAQAQNSEPTPAAGHAESPPDTAIPQAWIDALEKRREELSGLHRELEDEQGEDDPLAQQVFELLQRAYMRPAERTRENVRAVGRELREMIDYLTAEAEEPETVASDE